MQAVGSVSSLQSLSPNGSSRTVRNPQAATPNQVGPRDQFTPTGYTKGWAKGDDSTIDDPSKSKEAKGAKALEGFDIEKFRKEIRDELLAQIAQAKKNALEENPDLKMVSDIPYAVDSDEVAAQVPEEYNAENTSQRIVDFALSFRGHVKGMSDEEFISQVRSAVEEGFRLAKGDIGALPGPSAKLFNDTYEATMSKLDKALEHMKAGNFQTPTRPEWPIPEEQPRRASFSSVA